MPLRPGPCFALYKADEGSYFGTHNYASASGALMVSGTEAIIFA